jgi:hypothetical protein
MGMAATVIGRGHFAFQLSVTLGQASQSMIDSEVGRGIYGQSRARAEALEQSA